MNFNQINLSQIDEFAIQERVAIEKQVEAEMSALADAKSNTPSWLRIKQGDQLYIEQLIVELCAMAHGQSIAIDWDSN